MEASSERSNSKPGSNFILKLLIEELPENCVPQRVPLSSALLLRSPTPHLQVLVQRGPCSSCGHCLLVCPAGASVIAASKNGSGSPSACRAPGYSPDGGEGACRSRAALVAEIGGLWAGCRKDSIPSCRMCCPAAGCQRNGPEIMWIKLSKIYQLLLRWAFSGCSVGITKLWSAEGSTQSFSWWQEAEPCMYKMIPKWVEREWIRLHRFCASK